jgi:phosphopantetheinyl transferase (holo-ACP synthase)
MIYLVITIDVEPDCSSNWAIFDPLRFDGVRIGVKERLQPLFNKYGIVPTYLINNIVLEDDQSVAIFKGLAGDFELGTHLHPEFIEPDKTIFNYAGNNMEGDSCFYPPDIEFEKIKNITELFKRQFGYQPVSFRAGRFAAKEDTFRSLAKLGYKVDTSVTPYLCWNDKTHKQAVDHSNACVYPCWVNDKLLEVPVSIYKTRFKRIIWLRPTLLNYSQLCKVFTVVVKSQKDRKDIILNMMFHNVEVMPMSSPYTKTEADCRKYLEKLERFFVFSKRHNLISLNLSSLYDLMRQG